MNTWWQDLRYSIRLLMKKPSFTLIAVMTLALGIGANTAIFSVINRLLLNPLPFKDGQRLVYLWEANAQGGSMKFTPPPEEIAFWREQAKSFESIEVFTGREMTLIGGEEPEAINVKLITPNMLSFLGVEPRLGRGFLAEEAKSGADHVVLLSDGLWRRRFGADPAILGKQITLRDESYTVVGVMPPMFRLLLGNEQAWLPLVLNPTQANNVPNGLNVMARIKAGLTVAAAQAELNALSARYVEQHPSAKGRIGEIMTPQQSFGADTRSALFVMLAAVGIVLLIACANVANLLLARYTARTKEVAIRLALGAGRKQLIRQLLTESLLLALMGGAAGVLLALWGLDLIVALRPDSLMQLEDVTLDRSVLVCSLALSILTGLLFGLVPALQATRADLNHALKQGTQSSYAASGRRWFRQSLVVVEVALSFVLLVGAGLLIRSFIKLQQQDVGFRPDHLISMRLALPRSRYANETQQAAFFQQLLEQVRKQPGIEAAEITSGVPPQAGIMGGKFEVEGRTLTDADRPPYFGGSVVGQDYFRVVGIPILQGRTFLVGDTPQSPSVVVINDAMARRYWPGESPLGKRFRLAGNWSTVIGVAGNVKANGVENDTAAPFQIYMAYQQIPLPSMLVVARTSINPAQLAAALKSQVKVLDPKLPVKDLKTVEQMFSESLARRRFSLVLLSIFAGLAVALAAVGIYGLMSYSVSQRTPEIGVRMALGAQTHNIFRLVVGQGMLLAIIGVTMGLIASFGLTRFLASLLFTVSPTDPLTFAGIAVLLSVVALLACYLPARRAMKVDPMVALRYE